MDLGSSLTSNNVYEESIKKIFNMCRLEYHKTSFALIWLYSAEHSSVSYTFYLMKLLNRDFQELGKSKKQQKTKTTTVLLYVRENIKWITGKQTYTDIRRDVIIMHLSVFPHCSV